MRVRKSRWGWARTHYRWGRGFLRRKDKSMGRILARFLSTPNIKWFSLEAQP